MSATLRTLSLAVLCVAASACNSELTAAEYLSRAHDYEAAGKLRAAAIETRNAIQRDDKQVESRLLLGNLQLRMGHPADAEKEYSKARDLGATAESTVPFLATAMLQQGRFDEVINLAQVELSPTSQASLLASRALALIALDNRPGASRNIAAALRADGSRPDVQQAAARIDAAFGDRTKALTRLQALLEQEPEDASAWEFKGDLNWTFKALDDALAAYDKAVELAVSPLSARLKRAQLQLERGEPEAALIDLNALTKAGVKLAAIDVARGQIDLRNGKLLDAQLRFESAIRKSPDFTPAIGNLALTHLALGNVGQAEQYAKQLLIATEQLPEADVARRLLAAVRLQAGRFNLAEETIRPVLELGRPYDPFAARLMTTALLKQDKYDQAVAQMVRTIHHDLESTRESGSSALLLTRAPGQELIGATDRQDNAIERDADGIELDERQQAIAAILELLARKDMDEALRQAEALRDQSPEIATGYNLVARVHLEAGRETAAALAFEKTLEVDKENEAARQMLASISLNEGDVEAARAYLEGIGDKESRSLDTYLALAAIEARDARLEPMFEWLKRARDVYPEATAPVMAQARFHASRGEHEKLLAILGELNERQRAEPAVLQLSASALLALRRHKEALVEIERLIDKQPDRAEHFYQRAFALTGLRRLREARNDLERAVELAPDHAPALIALTNLDIAAGKLNAATAHIDTLRDLIPGSQELDDLVERLATRESDPGEKIPGKLRIDSSESALTAARSIWSEGQPERAIGLLSAWTDANPGDTTVRLALANSLGQVERGDEAVVHYEQLLDADLPDDATLAVLNNLAWYLREADPDRAITYAEEALELSPDSIATLDTLAMIHLGRADAVSAKKAFDKASSLGIEDPNVRFHGAQIEAELGNMESARQLLVPLVDNDVEFSEAEDAAELLQQIGR